MRFLPKRKSKKTVIVISDIHLGAGEIVQGKRNYLEDFKYDRELVDFLNYYSSGDYSGQEVELIINGDLFDLLAVPYVEYFDDEFWSEKASLAKMKMIIEGHPEVIEAFSNFVKVKGKKITYILGNHDAELILDSLKEEFFNIFDEKYRLNVSLIIDNSNEYVPIPGVVLKHGHEYEKAHQFSPSKNIIEDDKGEKYFCPPWGSYYVMRVINKFKEERAHINSVRPIRKFLINGLIYDTFFTLRFMFQTVYYFIMVRVLHFFKQVKSLKETIEFAKEELELFQDYEYLTKSYLDERDDVQALIVGHTHNPTFRTNVDGKVFINTGTWTDMHHLDFERRADGKLLTYAQIEVLEEVTENKIPKMDIALNNWNGANLGPYSEYRG